MTLPSAVMVQYYKSCPRELWFFAHKINMDYTDDNVQIGRQIHENAYSRERKSVHLGEVAIDVVKQEKDTIIFEIKKSRKLIEPAKYQLYYYLWYLKQIGKIVKGYLVYPKEKKKIEVTLTEDIEKEIEKIIEEIPKIVAMPVPPKVEKKPFCKRCAYYELCQV